MTESDSSEESDSHSKDDSKAALSERKQADEDNTEQSSEARDLRRANSQVKYVRVEKSESPGDEEESWSPEDGAGYIPGVSAKPSNDENSDPDDSDEE